jgi:methylmalonyl-CoA decarboxylase
MIRSSNVKYLATEFNNLIGTITLNNPQKRNSLCTELLDELVEALNQLQENKARVVIIRAAKGAKVWSSGFDINELPDTGRDPLSYNDPLAKALHAIQRFPAPVIAMIEGSVWGGACDLAFSCDLAFGAHSATFAITPAKIGVPYNSAGILHFLNILGMRITKEMFFTAQPLSAERAYMHGILNQLVPEEVLETFTYSVAENITTNSPLSITVMKEQLRILGGSAVISPETFERIQGLRRIVYDSNDYVEGKQAFLEKRKPHFTGE